MDVLSQHIDPKLQAQALKFIVPFVPGLVLKSAVLLKVPDIIAKAGPDAYLSVHQIAAQLPTQNPHLNYLSRILRYLAAVGVFSTTIDTSDEVRYGLTDMTKVFYVTENNPWSLVPMLLMQNHEVFMAPWQHLHECVLEGGDAFQKANGKDMWAYGRDDPQVNNIVNSAMASPSKVVMKRIVASYDGFSHVKTLVDVGGGLGAALAEISGVYPHIHGINFDLPHVVATAPVLPGIEHVGGNMFESMPSGDAIFMKSVLHDWDDERCLKILQNCHKALPENGKIILAERVLPRHSDPNGTMEFVVDLAMMAHTNGGRERTEKQWRALLENAGFSQMKILGRADRLPIKIVEGVKITKM